MLKRIMAALAVTLLIMVYGGFWYYLYTTGGEIIAELHSGDRATEILCAAPMGITAFCGGIGAIRQRQNFLKRAFLCIAFGIILCPFFGVGIAVVASLLQKLGMDIIGVSLVEKPPTMDELLFVASSYGYITSMWLAAVGGL